MAASELLRKFVPCWCFPLGSEFLLRALHIKLVVAKDSNFAFERIISSVTLHLLGWEVGSSKLTEYAISVTLVLLASEARDLEGWLH